MRDLNTLVPADAPVYLLFATAINADGAIAGGAYTRRPARSTPSSSFRSRSDNATLPAVGGDGGAFRGASVQPGVFRLRLRENGNVGIGLVPDGEESS